MNEKQYLPLTEKQIKQQKREDQQRERNIETDKKKKRKIAF